MDTPAQVPYSALADPPAIDIEAELGCALDEHHPGIDGAQHDHPAKRAVLDEVVDDAALQLERDDFYQKDGDGEDQEQQLMERARRQHIAKDTVRQLVGRDSPEPADPSYQPHRRAA